MQKQTGHWLSCNIFSIYKICAVHTYNRSSLHLHMGHYEYDVESLRPGSASDSWGTNPASACLSTVSELRMGCTFIGGWAKKNQTHGLWHIIIIWNSNVSIDKWSFIGRQPCAFIYVSSASGCFHAAKAALNSHNRDRVACKAWDIYFLALSRSVSNLPGSYVPILKIRGLRQLRY